MSIAAKSQFTPCTKCSLCYICTLLYDVTNRSLALSQFECTSSADEGWESCDELLADELLSNELLADESLGNELLAEELLAEALLSDIYRRAVSSHRTTYCVHVLIVLFTYVYMCSQSCEHPDGACCHCCHCSCARVLNLNSCLPFTLADCVSCYLLLYRYTALCLWTAESRPH